LAYAAPAGSGMTLLNTGGTAFTGSTITISSISQDYTNLFGVIIDLYNTSTTALTLLRLNGDTASNYAYSSQRLIGTTYATNISISDTSIVLNARSATSNTDKKKTFGSFIIPRYTESENKFIGSEIYGSDETNTVSMFMTGMYDSASAITSITILTDNTYSGGTLYLYGVK